jgi:hypothetical protein
MGTVRRRGVGVACELLAEESGNQQRDCDTDRVARREIASSMSLRTPPIFPAVPVRTASSLADGAA